MSELLGNLLLLVGAGFLFLGALGLLRMPDVYNRLQAGTKASTLGAVATLAGVGFQHPDWAPKLLLIALFILLTSPIGSSTIARAARRCGLEPWSPGQPRSGVGSCPPEGP
jgi:multicomponent Na+:H+ antiporter subunit G